MNEILLKYFSGELNTAQKKEFFQQLENDDDLRAEYTRQQNIFALVRMADHPSHEINGAKSYETFIRKNSVRHRKRSLRLVLQYAAISLFMIGSTLFLNHLFERSKETGYTHTLYVPAGQRAQLTLHDGTQVWLNSHSTLTYPAYFSGNLRQVSLAGEGYFKVAEDKKKPFIVSTSKLTMEVLGTEFNVQCYSETNYTKTSLVNGSLRVVSKDDKNKSIILSPDQQVTYADNLFKLEKITNKEHMLWRDGVYAFENERLIDILEKLELYYDITIQVEDPDIFNERYTGKFRQREGIDKILYILQKIQSFNIQKNREENYIILSK